MGKLEIMFNNRWWLLTLAGVVVLGTVQIFTVQKTKQQTEELRNLLAETQTQSLQLMRDLGYGGLIHNFKNFVLRSGEQNYRDEAVSSATAALELVTVLESNAAEVSSTASLTSTRQMILSYLTRLDQVEKLHAAGTSVVDIDQAVRFNDASAILEVQNLVVSLSRAVDETVEQLDSRGVVLSMATIAGTVILSGLTLALILNQRQRRTHLKVVESMNSDLETGNKKLLRANTSLKQFAGIVSHDLKSPLRHISMFNKLIMEDYDDKADVQEHVEKVGKATKRMDKIIASLLDFTLTGFAEPELSVVDITQVVTNVVDELRPTIDATSVQISMQLEGCVKADPELLERAFHNLISNSIKYRKADVCPHVEITAKRKNDKVHFSVSDNGIGIEPKFAERIFLPFQRLHYSQIDFEGNGIGLSLVKSIIEAHGGMIWLDKDRTEGTRLEFTLDAA